MKRNYLLMLTAWVLSAPIFAGGSTSKPLEKKSTSSFFSQPYETDRESKRASLDLLGAPSFTDHKGMGSENLERSHKYGLIGKEVRGGQSQSLVGRGQSIHSSLMSDLVSDGLPGGSYMELIEQDLFDDRKAGDPDGFKAKNSDGILDMAFRGSLPNSLEKGSVLSQKRG